MTVLKVDNIIYPQIWYFVALAIGKEKTKLYLDGKLIYTVSHDDLIQNDSPILVGKATYNSLSTRYFNGKIDDLRIYSRILSKQEIESIYINDRE